MNLKSKIFFSFAMGAEQRLLDVCEMCNSKFLPVLLTEYIQLTGNI